MPNDTTNLPMEPQVTSTQLYETDKFGFANVRVPVKNVYGQVVGHKIEQHESKLHGYKSSTYYQAEESE